MTQIHAPIKAIPAGSPAMMTPKAESDECDVGFEKIRGCALCTASKLALRFFGVVTRTGIPAAPELFRRRHGLQRDVHHQNEHTDPYEGQKR